MITSAVSCFGHCHREIPNEIDLERQLLRGTRMNRPSVSKRRVRRARPLLVAAAGTLLVAAGSGCFADGITVQPPRDLSAPDLALF